MSFTKHINFDELGEGVRQQFYPNRTLLGSFTDPHKNFILYEICEAMAAPDVFNFLQKNNIQFQGNYPLQLLREDAHFMAKFSQEGVCIVGVPFSIKGASDIGNPYVVVAGDLTQQFFLRNEEQLARCIEKLIFCGAEKLGQQQRMQEYNDHRFKPEIVDVKSRYSGYTKFFKK